MTSRAPIGISTDLHLQMTRSAVEAYLYEVLSDIVYDYLNVPICHNCGKSNRITSVCDGCERYYCYLCYDVSESRKRNRVRAEHGHDSSSLTPKTGDRLLLHVPDCEYCSNGCAHFTIAETKQTISPPCEKLYNSRCMFHLTPMFVPKNKWIHDNRPNKKHLARLRQQENRNNFHNQLQTDPQLQQLLNSIQMDLQFVANIRGV